MKKKTNASITNNEEGMVLVIALLLLAILVIIGTTAYLQTSTDIKISGNYLAEKEAFYDAEAGIHYIGTKLKQDLLTAAIDPTADTVTLSYARPAGFSFDPPASLTKIDSNRFEFSVTGHGDLNSQRGIEVEFTTRRLGTFEFGLFADGLVDLKASSNIYSYDSRVTPNPLPADSTNEGDVGSNTQINVYMDTLIDGDGVLGADISGLDGLWKEVGVPIINGESGVQIDRVDPDPLGAIGGPLAAEFTNVILNNDNALATGTGMSGSVINVGNRETLTLTGKAGGADYYITSLTLKNGATLDIDASAGPVNIYLSGTIDISEGDLEAKNGAIINSNGLPTDLNIFSNSIQSIVLKHGSELKAMIYAPYADVEIKNSGDVYGLIWGKTAQIHNSGDFYFDTALKDLYPSNRYAMKVVSWKDVRL